MVSGPDPGCSSAISKAPACPALPLSGNLWRIQQDKCLPQLSRLAPALSFSSEYNLLSDRVFLRIVRLLEEGSLFVSPPCTTFSSAAHPPLRTFTLPYGFRPWEKQTKIGTVLAHRAFALIAICLRLSC